MKKISVIIPMSILFTAISFAQVPVTKIKLIKGEKFLSTTSTTGSVGMEMMGQNMETISESSQVSTIEVKDETPAGYLITGIVSKMKVKTKGGFGPAMDFDSDKKEDMNSEIGKAVKDELTPKNMQIGFNGKALSDIKDSTNEDDMAKVMRSVMTNGAGDNGIAVDFILIPAGKKSGDVWLDSSYTNGIKINNIYTLKQLTGSEAIVLLNSVSKINKSVKAQGAEITIDMNSKISSSNIIDITSGLIKEKKTTVEGTGNFKAGGQEMPMKTKITSVTTIKKL